MTGQLLSGFGDSPEHTGTLFITPSHFNLASPLPLPATLCDAGTSLIWPGFQKKSMPQSVVFKHVIFTGSLFLKKHVDRSPIISFSCNIRFHFSRIAGVLG
jgi:hypothetical protein